MNLPHALSLIIQRSHSVPEILDSTVELIARELGTDVCSIYLLEPESGQVVLTATHGLDKSAVGKVRLELGQGLTGICVKELRPVSVEDASSHPGYLYFPETREEQFRSYLGVPMAIHSRPVGAIVVQTADSRPHRREEVETLYTIAAQLVGVVENARLIEALDRGEEGSRYLAEVRRWYAPTRGPAEEPRTNVVLRGTAASPGIALAEAVVRGSLELAEDVLQRNSLDAEGEKARLQEALDRTREDLVRVQKEAETQADEEHALIFSSHLLLLNDPVLIERIHEAIDSGKPAPVAVDRALAGFEERLRVADNPYLHDRIEDIRDLRSRLCSHLVAPGSKASSASDRIVVSRGAPPSLVVELKAEGASALVTEYGGATSHGALLARSMGIPAVTGIEGISHRVRTGDHLVVDGDQGIVILSPSPETVESYEAKMRQLELERGATREFCHLPGRTRDGRQVPILANIGVAADLAVARDNGAEGIGLYRTEFPFLIREQFPTREEQIRIYRKAWDAFPEGPVHFRLLDLGGDKFLPGGVVEADRNPFQGYRSVRVLLDHPDILRQQVQAFVLAADGHPLSIMVPMIARAEEFRRVREEIDEALRQLPEAQAQVRPRIGVMIELPAAVEIARCLAREADFLSIGTNDLIQYALAVDRENARSSSASDPYHPGVLSMIHRTAEAARREGIPVSVCGEMAADWRLALLLVALGIDALSVTPAAILHLKQALARVDVEPLERAAEGLLTLPSADDLREELEELLPGID